MIAFVFVDVVVVVVGIAIVAVIGGVAHVAGCVVATVVDDVGAMCR